MRQIHLTTRPEFTSSARRLGIVSAAALVLLQLAYTITLIVGFLLLESPDEPIADPMFSLLELLILAMMPVMLALIVVVHAWSEPSTRVYGVVSVVFMGALVVVTSGLHFTILTLSRQPAMIELPWLPLLLSFQWPSVAYALDILAWDVFFALSMFFAAPVFNEPGLVKGIRWLMIVSGLLALVGTAGVVTGDMQLRNVGIIGYLGVFPIVVILLGALFYRTPAQES